MILRGRRVCQSVSQGHEQFEGETVHQRGGECAWAVLETLRSSLDHRPSWCGWQPLASEILGLSMDIRDGQPCDRQSLLCR